MNSFEHFFNYDLCEWFHIFHDCFHVFFLSRLPWFSLFFFHVQRFNSNFHFHATDKHTKWITNLDIMSHWHTIERVPPFYMSSRIFFSWFFCFAFFSLLFRVFIPWFSLWSISLALISCTFFSIANDCNCNDLILFYRSFIPKTHVHNSTTQVAPPVSLLFSNGFTFHLHYRCILPKVSMINFHGRHGHGTQLPLFVCLLVCLSICISVFRWMYCTMGEGYKIASRDKSTNR